MLTITAGRGSHFREPGFLPDMRPVVFAVHDDPSVCRLLASLAGDAGWRSEVFDSPADFLAEPRAYVPSCLVLDVGPPPLDGLYLQRQIVLDRKDIPIIFITAKSDVPTTVRAMKAGASDFFTKAVMRDTLADAIHRAVERSRAALKAEAELTVLKDRHTSLSGRENEVMGLVVSGLLNKQVAGVLGISEITVKAHRGRMMRKMEARSVPDLVRICAQLDVPSVRR